MRNYYVFWWLNRKPAPRPGNIGRIFAFFTLSVTLTLEITGQINLIPGNPGESIPRGDVQINSCHGNLESANFRDYPAYESNAIKGAVPQGEWVALTGERTSSDGIRWYAAKNHSPLQLSEDGYPMNYRPEANQLGWIADCFVE